MPRAPCAKRDRIGHALFQNRACVHVVRRMISVDRGRQDGRDIIELQGRLSLTSIPDVMQLLESGDKSAWSSSSGE